jgi:hypothetical protein
VARTLSKGKHDDRGDLEDPCFVYECKDDASRSPMQWWEQAEAARLRTGKPYAVVLAKARMPKPGQPRGWAQMSIEQWQELREYIGDLEAACRMYGVHAFLGNDGRMHLAGTGAILEGDDAQ